MRDHRVIHREFIADRLLLAAVTVDPMSKMAYSNDDHDSSASSDDLLDQETIFADAVKIESDAERTAFLDRACRNDLTLRAGVDQLLEMIDCPQRIDGALMEETISEDEAVTSGEMPGFLEQSDAEGSLGRLGSYEILEVLGRGGMGLVLKALDTRLNRTVAVKVLAPHLAAHPKARSRFMREAQAAAAISHPNVVTIHSVEEANDVPYLVMECVEGETLTRKIQREGKLKTVEILQIGVQLARGLAAAHSQRLIHRDVKPCNILIEADGKTVKITDFGLARAVDDLSITRTGEVSGTPQFMSPEQAEGHPIDHRCDLFSLGSVFYAMCAGRSPFRAETSMAVLRRVCDHPARPVHELNPDIPSRLTQVIHKLLEKKPDDRIQTAAEVATLMEKHLAYLQAPSMLPEPDDIGPIGEPVDSADIPRLPIESAADDEPASSRRWLPFLVILLLIAVGPAIAEFAGLSLFRKQPEPQQKGDAPDTDNGGVVIAGDTPSAAERLLSPDWQWADAHRLGSNINSVDREDEPLLSHDEKTLYFRSNRLGGIGSDDLWYAVRDTKNDSWSPARIFDAKVNGPHSESSPALGGDGRLLIFVVTNTIGEGDSDLWMSTRDNNGDWAQATPLGDTINTGADEIDPCLSADGKTLFFARNRPDNRNDFNIWMSRRENVTDPWPAPEQLSTAINTPGTEGGPHLSPDGLVLLYHSGDGPSIWMSRRDSPNGDWKRGVEIYRKSPGGAAHPHLTLDATQLYFRSTDGSHDLWRVKRRRVDGE
eukprot:g5279.t1